MVRRNPAALRIDDAEAVGIAIGGEAYLRLVRDHGFGQGLQIFFGHIRAGAFEKNVALGANGFVVGDPVLLQRTIEIAGAASVQRVVNDARRVLLFQFVETDELAQAREVRRGDVYLLKGARVMRRGESRTLLRRPSEKLCGASFDIARDFGQRRTAIGSRKFQAVIFRRIVARGEVDGAVDFAAANFVGHRGRGRRSGAEQRMHTALVEHGGRSARELFGKEARVVRHKQRGAPIAA